MYDPACPEEAVLMPLAMDDEVAPAVREHVEGCPKCDNRVRELREELAGDRRSMEYFDPIPQTVKWRTSIGKYRVIAPIGRGGQGDVFRAYDPILERDVAVKLLRGCDYDAHQQQRLLKEAKSLATCDHPNLAQVYDVDFEEDRPFLVTEFIAGEDVVRYSASHKLAGRQLATIVAKVARALQHCHEKGVIHGDIKPENILIVNDVEPRIIDFGVAEILNSLERDDSEVGGTPAYMAPEQARGDSQAMGPTTDIFGVGALLYYLVVGKPPFEADDATASLERARECNYDEAALRASKAPGSLRRICRRALDPIPTNRFHTAGELARALAWYIKSRRLMKLAVVFIVIVAVLATTFFLVPNQRSAGLHTTPQLAVFHRVDSTSRILITDDRHPVSVDSILELEPELESTRFQYLLTMGGDGVATIYPANDLEADEKGAWYWQPGPPNSETLVLLTVRRELSDEELAELTTEIATLPQPAMLRDGQRISWESGSWRTVEVGLKGRGNPLSPDSSGWADGFVRLLRGIDGAHFHGITLPVRESSSSRD